MSIPTLPTRRIGKDNVTAVGFGAMGIGGLAYGKVGDEESRYGGDSEVLIGNWFKRTGKRDKIFLATKFGITPNKPRGTPEYVKEALDKSLKRLGVDTIDLYYIHRIDQTVPIETTISTLAELIKAGKIRYIGLSEPSPATLRRAHKVHPIAAVQVEYSPFILDIEQKGHLLETARELGITVVAYSPLGRGLLTGQITSHDQLPEDDFRKKVPKYSDANFPKILKLVSKVKEVGEKHGATPGQVSVAFLLAQGDDIIPIPGLVPLNRDGDTRKLTIIVRTKNVKYAEENIGSLKVNLTPEDIKAIRQAITETELTGDQYPAEHMAILYGDTPELPK
ncbi:hypothetical protein FRC07_010907 [Ceratobasidium sp. 392]|nr:hypothetical protein FRC07_010907 [Ceratobasidium sp. 392]